MLDSPSKAWDNTKAAPPLPPSSHPTLLGTMTTFFFNHRQAPVRPGEQPARPLKHRWLSVWIVAALFQLLLATTCLCQETASIRYLRDIQPLLRTKCNSCHGALKQEAGLRLDAGSLIHRGSENAPVIDLKNPSQSPLLSRIASHDIEIRMPPEGNALTEQQIELIRSWIVEGASYPADELIPADPRRHWSFQQIQRPTIDSKNQNPIDHFLLKKLSANGLTFAPAADRRTLNRRIFLDMHGLPPSVEEVEAFVSSTDPTAYEQLVDQVLDSPRYGERWGQHWLDIVRYADTHGYEVNTPRPNAWPYRDYVIGAFNSDKPFDQFILQQIAGDKFGEDAATGLLVAAPVLLPGQIGQDDASKRLARQDALDEIIVGTASTFLGLTVGCARCHDHKFDPISQKDYYRWQAFLSGVEYEERPVQESRSEDTQQTISKLQAAVEAARKDLLKYHPMATEKTTLLIDEENTEFVTVLKKSNGTGSNPPGDKPGYQNDIGDAHRSPNLSGGRYTWWDNVQGEDVISYHPKLSGAYDLWLSWGAHGSGVHTRDARYVVDQDGDLGTRDDQTGIASIDQYYPAYTTTGTTEQAPLWSGLWYAGSISLTPSSQIVVRGGATGTGITADVIVLQQHFANLEASAKAPPMPRLRSPISPKKNIERFSSIPARWVRFTSLATIDANRHEPCIDELEIFASENPTINLATADRGVIARSSGNYSDIGIHQLKHVHDGKYGNSQSWISNTAGTGWVELELPQTTTIDRIEWSRDFLGEFADRLPVRYRIEVASEPNQWTVVASSHDRLPQGTPHSEFQSIVTLGGSSANREQIVAQLKELQTNEKQLQDLQKPCMVFSGRFREPDPTHLLNRGDSEQPGELLEPGFPEVIRLANQQDVSGKATDQERRESLARWIASAENPLTARVIANRVWQFHFGQGIVTTSSDFGLNGAPPTHPELLDWLASYLIDNQWSIKKLHRQILLSQAFQQGSLKNEAGEKIDAANQLLWHFPSRRLEAEAIRDSMLAVSGQLSFQMGGPGFDFFRSRGGLDGFPPIEKFDKQGLRRMVYAHKVRMEKVPIFGLFDCPDAGQPISKRTMSTTPIQSLNLFNGQFVLDTSTALAQHVKSHSSDSLEQQVRAMYLQVLSREPSKTEQSQSLVVVEKFGLATLARVLFNSNEFLFLP